jgi:hypothetical protein
MNVAKLNRILKLFVENEVHDEKYLVMGSSQWESLTNDTRFSDRDYTETRSDDKPGLVGTWKGMLNFMVIGDRDEGGLPVDGSLDRTCYAWAKRSVGLGIGKDVNLKMSYENDHISYLIVGILKANAVAIDDTGIVKITCRESA